MATLSALSVRALSTDSANLRPVASVTMRLVGLTGGIGSGQVDGGRPAPGKGRGRSSTPTRWRARSSSPGQPALDALVERFGAGILDADGRLDRAGPRRDRLRRRRRPQGPGRDHLAGDRRGVRAADHGRARRQRRGLRRAAPGREQGRGGPALRGGHRGRGPARRPPRPARDPRRAPRRRRTAHGGPGDRRRAPGGGHPSGRQRRRPRRRWPRQVDEIWADLLTREPVPGRRTPPVPE